MLINFVDATNDANHYTKPRGGVSTAVLLRPEASAESGGGVFEEGAASPSPPTKRSEGAL